jgi:hypothetical protein
MSAVGYICAFFPAVVALLAHRFTKDLLATVLLVQIIGFSLPYVFILKSGVNLELRIPKEIIDKDKKISLGVKLLVASALGLPIFYFLWTRFLPAIFGPKFIVFSFPILEGFKKILYAVAFVLVVLLTAVTETAYFNVFTASKINGDGEGAGGAIGGLAAMATGKGLSFCTKLTVSIAAGLLYFFIAIQMLNPFTHAFIFAGIVFALNFIIVSLFDEHNAIAAVMFRIGLAIALLLCILYLNLSVQKQWKRQNPEFVFLFNPMDALAKLFGTLPKPSESVNYN